MRRTIRGIALLILLTGYLLGCKAQTVYREEFNGAFPSWANAKLRFKAAGDGSKDDTKALQTAIDSLTVYLTQDYNVDPRTRYIVIYLPAGTYNISQTLRINGKIGFSIIGEDPAKTIIRWKGRDNDTMLVANGSSYYKISRLTWDAGGAKNIEGIGIHWLDKNGVRFAPTSIELSDMLFKGGLAYGIFGGTYGNDGVGANDAEVTIKRCKFYSCSAAGIAIKGFNSLDYWIWHCEFTQCAKGIQNTHGNYHVYYSNFYGSTVADCDGTDGYYTSARGCYSKGSNAFSFDNGASCNAFKRIYESNTVENVKTSPIRYHSQGRITMLNNHFAKSGYGITLNYNSWCPALYQVLSVGNYYEDTNPYRFSPDFTTNVFSSNDRKITTNGRLALPAQKAVQPFLPLVKRTVLEVPAGANTAAIQAIINKAAGMKGQRPVVHFPIGKFVLQKAIEIPAGCDMQLTGDGILYATILAKDAGYKDDCFFKVKGPSYVTFQDLHLFNDDGKTETGIVFDNVDQPSSEVHIDQIYSLAKNALYVDRLNYTYFEKNNSFFSTGTTIVGGNLVAQGKGTSKVYCFGGQSAGTSLSKNAVFVAKDCWWEGAYKKDFLPVDLVGDGRITIDGALFAPKDIDSLPVLRIGQFKGSVTLSDLYVWGGMDIANNNADVKVLVWNVNFMKKQVPTSFIKSSFKPQLAMLGITTQCFKNDGSPCKDDNILSFPDTKLNVANVNSFLGTMTTDLNSMPRALRNIAGNTSNVNISRVSVTGGSVALRFQP